MSKKNRNTNKALKALKKRSSYRRGGRAIPQEFDFGRSYRERQLNSKKEDKPGSGPVKTAGSKEPTKQPIKPSQAPSTVLENSNRSPYFNPREQMGSNRVAPKDGPSPRRGSIQTVKTPASRATDAQIDAASRATDAQIDAALKNSKAKTVSSKNQQEIAQLQKEATAAMSTPEYQSLLKQYQDTKGDPKIKAQLEAIQEPFKKRQQALNLTPQQAQQASQAATLGANTSGITVDLSQMPKPKREDFGRGAEGNKAYQAAVKAWEAATGGSSGGGNTGGGDQDPDPAPADPPPFGGGTGGEEGTPYTAPKAEVVKAGQAVDYAAMAERATQMSPMLGGKKSSTFSYDPATGNFIQDLSEMGFEGDAAKKVLTPEQFYNSTGLQEDDFFGDDPSLQTSKEDIQEVEAPTDVTATSVSANTITGETGTAQQAQMPGGFDAQNVARAFAEKTGLKYKIGSDGTIRFRDGQGNTFTRSPEDLVDEFELEGDFGTSLKAQTYQASQVGDVGTTEAAQGKIEEDSGALAKVDPIVSLTQEAKGETLTQEEIDAAKGTAADRPESKDYADAITTDEKFTVGDVTGPDVTTRDGIEISPEERARLREIAKGRGVDIEDLPEFKKRGQRTVQTGTAAERTAQELGETPEAIAATAEYFGADFTPQGGKTEIDDVPAYKVAAQRTAQVGEAAQGIAQTLGNAPSVDLQGREAITGTAPQGDASQIGGIPTMAAATMQAVTGEARKTAAADMAAVVANLPKEVTAAISEDPATVEAQLDDPNTATEVKAAVAALPEEALVSTQMENLLAGMEEGKTPAWARPAVAAIEQQMAQRGLSASTVGRDALFNAIIQSALPMAQSNAQALQQRAQQNLTNEQQANLASAQNTMQIRMANLANRQTAASQTAQMAQQIKLQKGEFGQQATVLTAQQTQQTELANFQAAQQKAQQESSQRQQAALANLDAASRTDLANLQALNQAGSQNLSAEQQTRLSNYNAQINRVMKQAELQQDMEKANLSASLQTEMLNLNNMNLAAKDTMTAEQTERLTNLQTFVDFKKTNAAMAQQMEMANLSNDQQMRMAELSDRAATDAANFTAENQFELAELNAKVQRATRQAELNQRMEEVNLDASLKVELAELTERNTTSRANMSAEQQTRLANLNVLVDFRKTNAAMAQQMDMANMANEQQMELANLKERSEVDAANFTEDNRFRLAELNTTVQVMSQNEQLKQQADLANLSMEERISLANLSEKNKAASESMTAENMAELQVYEKKMAAAQTNAQLAQQMGLANLSNEQASAMFNAQIDANMDMKQFDANQQMALANSQFMQTATLANLNNEQQAAMQNATAMANLDLATVDQNTKLAVQNAQAFLQMDMANLANEQQANILDQQNKQQRMLSNQAAENAAKQFNATSENQTQQFMASMEANMSQFNTTQTNAMEQFNTAEKNRIAAQNAGNQLQADQINAQITADVGKFNAQMDAQAEQWNAANAQAIEQSNVAWRRSANTAETAAQNAANQQQAAFQFDMDKTTQAQMWQQMRDQAAFNFQEGQSERDRIVNVVNAALSNEAFMTEKGFASQRSAIFAMLNTIKTGG